MPGEQIWPDRRTEQWCSSGRKILTSAQGLRYFSESSTGKPMLSFQYHASSEMRGCLRHLLQEAPGFVLMLEAHDDVVGIPDHDHVARGLTPSPACGPEVENVMEIDVREQR